MCSSLKKSVHVHIFSKVVSFNIKTEQKKNNLLRTNNSIKPLNFCFIWVDGLEYIVTISHIPTFYLIHIFGIIKIKMFLSMYLAIYAADIWKSFNWSKSVGINRIFQKKIEFSSFRDNSSWQITRHNASFLSEL